MSRGRRPIEMAGRAFGRLTVLGVAAERRTGKGGCIRWRCRCSCGAEHEARGDALRQGEVRSCGCLRRGRPGAETLALEVALRGCVELIEAWAYGPIMRAGVGWPDGVCRAPALLEAKRLLGMGCAG